uniref:Inhibitor of growth protein N-terminal histone-binding domain-containing protein n=1 Tax=Trichuris muris TaxID=70415 RepID=A0A5S6Q9F3_TRIMR
MEALIPRVFLQELEDSAITELDLNLTAEDVENYRDVLIRQSTFVKDFTRRMNEEITARRRNFVQLYVQCAPKRILVEKILRLHDRNNNYRASLTALNDATDDYKRRIQQWKKATVGVLAKMHEMRQSRRATNSAGVDEQGPSTSSDGVCSGTTAPTGGTHSDNNDGILVAENHSSAEPSAVGRDSTNVAAAVGQDIRAESQRFLNM